MIFLTVGHQMAFDRLVRWADEWAELHPDVEFLAQIGHGIYAPNHMQTRIYLTPEEFEHYLQRATGVVAHAGTGTLIKALYLGKPLLVVPRLERLGETRNDHQVGTANHFAGQGLVQVAEDQATFSLLMNNLGAFKPQHRITDEASSELISGLRTFLNNW